MLEFRFRSLSIGVRFSFFAVLLLMAELCRSDWGLWCAAASILHELGHFAAYAALGQPPRALYFEAGGIRITPPGGHLPLVGEAAVLLAGSSVNLAAGGLFCLLGKVYAGGFHLFLGLFNLLPLAQLDGGMLLALVLEQLFPPRPAGLICGAIHWLCWGLLFGAGCLLLWRTGNFTLIFTILCLTFPQK